MRRFAIVVLLLAVASCTSHAVLRNEAGQAVDCRYLVVGPVSAIVGASLQEECVRKYERLGFRRAPVSAVEPEHSGAAARVSAAPASHTGDFVASSVRAGLAIARAK